MFKSAISIAFLALCACQTLAQNVSTTKVGYSGVLTKTDGGLGGTVTVKNAMTLEITSYTLKDASAPALYWWGTTNGVLKDGFRISNTQVTMAAASTTLEINLDAGKTTADFDTVGLWCERLSANFGQATLAASTASTPGAATGTTTAPPAATTSKSGAANTRAHMGAIVGAIGGAVGFAMWMA
ncbi:hypothetical protein GLAREA_07261 [Glarea lozoyensis ATCC 20868]|uniref:DM13 domain-containing protein n=2 Tax=Glarea lozoyensis TaxID=101852 RepID=S3E7E6_GLAL2|nr:uncharacterized protein GLAREA_07261 [Glarea lozoyensis ATCC 20868]EPE34248.1 hypothetical protein GLAREA_07261 [Glarea lozoyensis ATCC 20868]